MVEKRQVIWSQKAIDNFGRHCAFRGVLNEASAKKLNESFLAAANSLRFSPYPGQYEPLFSGLHVRFRTLLIEDTFMLVYRARKKSVEIYAIWDCRQNDESLRRMIEK